MTNIELQNPAGRFNEAWNGIVRREQIGTLVRQAPFLALANIVNSTLVVLVVATEAPFSLRAGWWLVVFLSAVYPLKNWLRNRRVAHPVPWTQVCLTRRA